MNEEQLIDLDNFDRLPPEHQARELARGINIVHTYQRQQNGRVRDLENWRNVLTGGLGVLTVVVLPIAFKVIF